jgi:peroxiredoxin
LFFVGGLFCVYAQSLFGQVQEEWMQKFHAADNQAYCLNDFKEAELLVLVFTRNTCPIAVDYQSRLNEISSSFEKTKVEIVSINVDEGPGESLEDMRNFARKNKLKFRYLHDPKKILARSFKAKTTPHVFVLNKKREVVYQGLIDSNFDEEQVTEEGRYLFNSINAVLSDKKVPDSTAPKGCSIRY